jgi:nicotinate-nucleotide--dimethylbenzimidazole phosphoribosyltransferase
MHKQELADSIIQEELTSLLNVLRKNINNPDRSLLIEKIGAHLDNLTKPRGSLGRLEEVVMQYGLCRHSAQAPLVNAALYVFAADHGITEEGVSLYPSDVTYQMVLNMLSGGAAISVLCRNAGIDCKIVDIGVKTDISADISSQPGFINTLLQRKVRPGTHNFLKTAAMSPSECWTALKIGYELAAGSQADLLGIGEMGIGNTAAASALFSLLLQLDAIETVGCGTGLEEKQLKHKQTVIGEALKFHLQAWDGTPFEALRRVGGLEIAGMAGFIMGAINSHIPVVIDGFIASAAALVCIRMEPAVGDYLFFAHQSAEQFHCNLLARLNKRPLLDLGMRLGEGTGSALAMMLIRQALNCYHEMATFTQAGVSDHK